jgi:hypothetical protein
MRGSVALDASDASDTGGTTVAEDAAGELLKQRTSSLIITDGSTRCLRSPQIASSQCRARADSHNLQTRLAVGVSLGTFHVSS